MPERLEQLGGSSNRSYAVRVRGHERRAVEHTDSQLAGIGSDLDGGFGREQTPLDIDTIADLQALAGLIEDRGHSPAEVAALMHGNWLRFLADVLP